MNLTIEFQWTYEEFREGIRAITLGSGKKPRYATAIIGWALFITLAILTFFVFQSKPRPVESGIRDDRPSFLVWAIGPAMVAVICVVAFVIALKRISRKAFDREPDYHRMQSMHVSDQGVAFSNTVTQTTTRWDGYVKFGESENVFLLFTRANMAQIIPKRAFGSAAEVDEFRAFASSAIGRRQSAFPVLPPKAS